MKLRYRSSLHALRLRLDKREKLDYARATWLQSCETPCLLPASVTDLSSSKPDVYYRIEGLISLERRLKTSLSCAQYKTLLLSLCSALEMCVEKQIAQSGICFEPEFVYVDESDHMRFALLPIEGASTGTSALELLSHLGDTKAVRFVLPDDERHARAVCDFTRRSAVLQTAELRSFLSREFGADQTRTRGDPRSSDHCETSSRWASRAAGRGDSCPPEPAGSMSLDPVSLLMSSPSARDLDQAQPLATRVARRVAAARLRSDNTPTDADPPHRAGQPQTGEAGSEAATSSVGSDSASKRADGTEIESPSSPTPPPHEGTTLLSGGRPTGGATSQIPQDEAGAPSPQSGRLFIVCVSTDERRELERGDYILGRSLTCDISFTHNSNISRRHASLRVLDKGEARPPECELRDLGSANGTRVNGVPLVGASDAKLEPEQIFHLADEAFRIEWKPAIGAAGGPGRG